MNNYTLEDVREYIQDLINGKEVTEDGVCAALEYKFGFILIVCNERYKGKPTAYPVEAPDSNAKNGKIYNIDAYHTLPKWSGEYGENRKHYCKWLLEDNNLQGIFR